MTSMISLKTRLRSPRNTLGDFKGFTLLELMVGIVVTGIVATGILTAYFTSVRSFTNQRDVAVMQMNLRGSAEDMGSQVRMAGYDPRAEMPRTDFGIKDVRRWTVTDENTAPAASPSGQPALTLIYDNYNQPGGADGVLDINDNYISYRLFDDGGDGLFELARDTMPAGSGLVTPRQILAENIQAVGFAYAYDDDGNGLLDTAAGNHIIWAVDSDNDNLLDTNLDADGDGNFTEADDTNHDMVINNADQTPNGAMLKTVPLSSVRSIRIWLLARADKPTKNYINKTRYQVGDRILSAANGDFDQDLKCRLLVQTIQGRNLGTVK